MRIRLALVTLITLAPALARAQVFAENWENDGGAWFTKDTNPLVLQQDAGSCSSTYQHETVRFSGGRVWTRSPIAVDGGEAYCFSAWVRGSGGAQPFIGINNSYPDAGTEKYTDGGSGEHWLIGHTGYATDLAPGDNVTAVTANGQWHWYTKSFTMPLQDAFIEVKDELFSGGSAGSADFDDLELWEGNCPATADGAAHTTCSGSTPICDANFQCVQCQSDLDCPGQFCVNEACVACRTSADCSGNTPVCDSTSHDCRACSGDGECGGTTPACDSTSGACVACTANSYCASPTAVCDTTSETCVECVGNGDCSDPTKPVCSGNACIGCASDGDCSGSTPACQPNGSCGQCSLTHNTCASAGLTPICDVLTGFCVSCTQDSDCLAQDSCHTASCVSNACQQNAVTDGTSCANGGSCESGVCVVPSSTSSSNGASSSTTGASGSSNSTSSTTSTSGSTTGISGSSSSTTATSSSNASSGSTTSTSGSNSATGSSAGASTGGSGAIGSSGGATAGSSGTHGSSGSHGSTSGAAAGAGAGGARGGVNVAGGLEGGGCGCNANGDVNPLWLAFALGLLGRRRLRK